MPPVTEVLRECHRLRKHLRDLQAEIDRGPRVLRVRQETLEAERKAHKEHHESITRLKLKQREDEGTLKQTETRLAKLEDQLTGISVQKEYAAKQSEIDQSKAKKGALEDAILATIVEIEEKTAAIPAVEKQWADAQAEFAEFQKQAAERLERLKGDLVASGAELARVETALPEAQKAKYDHLVKTHGPDSFAAVRNRTCSGCQTSITEQRQSEIRGGSFVLCSNCGKMLYPGE